MGFLDKIKAALGLSSRANEEECAVEGERLVFRSLKAAERVPRQPGAQGPTTLDACGACAGPVRRFVFTTAGEDRQAEVWRAYPLAVDGWLCPSCGWSVVPRRVSAAEITEMVETGAAHGNGGELDDAEYWFLRAASSWPDYPPALLNLAQVRIKRGAAGPASSRTELRREAIRLFGAALLQPEHCPLGATIELARAEAIEGDEETARRRLGELSVVYPSGDDAQPLETVALGFDCAIDRCGSAGSGILPSVVNAHPIARRRSISDGDGMIFLAGSC